MNARWMMPILAAVAWASLGTAARAATSINTFGSWTLYREAGASQLCFLAAPPAESTPPGLNRDAPLLYVSAWIKDGVKAEISVRLGFVAKRTVEPTILVIGGSGGTFKLFVKDDRAFVADPTQELKLLDAMKKGSKLQVQATSERGTAITDSYTLSGITAGLQALAGGCG